MSTLNRMLLAASFFTMLNVGALAQSQSPNPAPPSHPDNEMLRGTHTMQGTPKPGAMSNKVMPSRSPDCSPEALAKMQPEHRKACESGR